MQVTVTFRHVDSSEALRQYAADKTGRLDKYLLDPPVEVHWVLSTEKIRHIAAVTVTGHGLRLKALEETDDLYSAIDLTIDKLEKQVRKFKEKAKNHHKPESIDGGLLIEDVNPPQGLSETAGGKPRVVTTTNVFIKPMSVEEATMQMDVVDNEFLVFTNSSTNNVNVLYSRDDGNYGLIEAENK